MVRGQENRQSFVVFEVGGQSYGLDVRVVEQIMPLAELDRPPAAPPLLAGFLNLAGTALPVVALHRLIGAAATPATLWTPLIILRRGASRLALLVDRVHDVWNADAADMLPLPPGHALNECLEGIVRAAGRSVLLLSPERLLLEEESRVVSELQALAQQRVHELEGVEA